MVESDYFSLCLLLFILILFIIIVKGIFKIKDLKSQLALSKKETESLRGKISMVEYYHRNYVEGKNPYTMMREIGEVLEGYKRYEDKE